MNNDTPAKAIRILHLEDDADDAELLRMMLEQAGIGFDVILVQSEEDYKASLQKETFDIIISDYSLPSFNGAAALRLARQSCPEVPFLFLSGTIGEDAAVEALLAGATDYVLKGNPKRLIPAITRALEEAKQRKERQRLEGQFLQAQKMEAVGRLAGGVAHDFNNLLTAILGNCEFALDNLDRDHPSRKDIEEIRECAYRAASLTRQLLAFSRREIVDLRVLDLNDVVSGTEKLLRRLIGEDLEFVTILGKELGQIEADSGQIEQVIMNLAVNARDAMPHGGRLTIQTANTELDETPTSSHFDVKSKLYVMLTVSDTGTGMDRETIAHLFEPFFTTKEPGKGTGLGLSTVYAIVERSGGYIDVDSRPGRGTTFRIYFPRIQEAVHAPATAASVEKSLKGSETILLVEDQEEVRRLAYRALAQYGYTVLPASNAEQAIEICHQHENTIHLVITDVILSGMNGADLAKEVLQLRPNTPVLYLSGYAENVIVHKGVLKPDIHFLQKPFTPEGLARKIREVFEKG